jgi:hypothetical protein
MYFAIASHGLGAALVPLHSASVDPRASVSQIDILTPESGYLAGPGSLPKLKENKFVIVRALCSEGL